MATLIVTLPLEMPGPGIELDYVLTTDGQSITRQGRAAAGLLPPLPGAGHEVVAVVPARALSWHQVSLPGKLLAKAAPHTGPQPQLRAALDGLLEDQLLDEAATLHFALAAQDRAPAGRWIAACRKDWLRAHLQALEEARHPVARIVPEFEPAAPDVPPVLHVTTGLDPAQLVRPGAQGVTVLPLGPGAARLLAWPEDAPILAEPAVASQAEHLFRRPVTLQSAAERWLQSARSGWNLAQFELARTGRTQALKDLARGWNSLRHAPQWRAARWLLLALLASQLLGLNALAWKERSLLAQKQQALRDTLRQTFPEVQVVLDAPLQMERQLSALQQATGAASARDLEAMLSAVGSAVAPQQTLSEITYGAGEARLQGLKLGADEGSEFSNRLRALGYTARRDPDGWVVRPENTP